MLPRWRSAAWPARRCGQGPAGIGRPAPDGPVRQDLIEPPVVTASRQIETRDQTPAQILVITREQIRERRYRSLADLMRDLPGVDWQGGTKSSQFNPVCRAGLCGAEQALIPMDGCA